jgi:hypothetical protein
VSAAAKIAYTLAGAVVLAGLVLIALAHVTLAPRPVDARVTPDALVAAISAPIGNGTRTPDHATISRHPIFVAVRRMPPPAPEPVPPAAPTTAPLPSLVGTMIEPNRKMAVLKKVNEAKILSLTEGQSMMAGY